MIEETIRKLTNMKLFAMADKLREFTQNNRSGQLDSTEQLAFMVDAEYDRRKNNRIKRLLRNAKIKLAMACVEDIDYSPARNLKKSELTDLLLCNFIEHHHNVLISGATGTGKTYVACALANLACRHGFTAIYYRASKFLEFMELEKATHKRRLLYEDLHNQIFKKYDILLCPTTPVPAFDIDMKYPETIGGRAASVLTFISFLYIFNMTGLPAASIPSGFTSDGLPLGMQIVGKRFDELTILQVAKAFEEVKPWQDKKPSLN